MTIVCFDTQIVIWGLKEEATPGQEHMIPKARYLIDRCDQEKKTVVIPTIVVAELLSGLDSEMFVEFNRVLESQFLILPFDFKAANLYAKIWKDKRQVRKDLLEQGKATRAELKADSFIVATAVANNADCIYTYDDPLKKFAKGFIDTRSLPDCPPVQQQLI